MVCVGKKKCQKDWMLRGIVLLHLEGLMLHPVRHNVSPNILRGFSRDKVMSYMRGLINWEEREGDKRRENDRRKRASERYERTSWKVEQKKEGSSSGVKEAMSTNRPSTHTSTYLSKDTTCRKCLKIGHIVSQCPKLKTIRPREVCIDQEKFKTKRDQERKYLREEKDVKSKNPNFKDKIQKKEKGGKYLIELKEVLSNPLYSYEGSVLRGLDDVLPKEECEATYGLEGEFPKEAPYGLMTCMGPQRYDHPSSKLDTLLVEMHGTCYSSRNARFDVLLDELHSSSHLPNFALERGVRDVPSSYHSPKFDLMSMSHKSRELIGERVVVCFHDILVNSTNFGEHLEHMKSMMHAPGKGELYANL